MPFSNRVRTLRRFGILFFGMFMFGATLIPVLNPTLADTRAATDSDRDGYPDLTELRGADRDAFNEWFARIAESQFYGISSDWALAEQDCSGLVRYAFKNALLPHDAAWLAKFKFLPRGKVGQVEAYSWPLPLIRYAVYRVAPGRYEPSDVREGRLSVWASAKYLANFSSEFVTKDWRQARRGDLLFFLRPNLGSYHSMVYLGKGMVVYHTGESPEHGGEVRLLSLETLSKHPDRAFHVQVRNPSFLGFYRWKILQ
jgi:uncharacterized protein